MNKISQSFSPLGKIRDRLQRESALPERKSPMRAGPRPDRGSGMTLANILLLLILFGAAFVRLYRIQDFTEFKGDQGSTGVILYDAVQKRELPLVGPQTSTGEYPGPAYYYLVAPFFILSHFNPLFPAIMFAVLGVTTVYFLFYLAESMFGVYPALVASAIRAFSPVIVSADINMWNPTAIPFFVLLIVFSLYKIHQNRKPIFLLLAAFCLGILIQLHYTDALWIPVIAVFWMYESMRLKKKMSIFLGWSIAAIGAFLLPLITFLYYEILHRFYDIRSLLFQFFGGRGGESTRFLVRLQTTVNETLFRSFILLKPWELWIIAAVIVSVPLVRRKNFWATALASMVFFNIVAFSFYKGTVFDHYLKFFAIVSLLLFAGFLSLVIPRRLLKPFCVLFIVAILLLYIPKLNFTTPAFGDITRTKTVTEAIIEDSGNLPFSFGVISSASFSDYHYRFYFHIAHHDPMPVLGSYMTLYLVCESASCPSGKDIHDRTDTQVICYDLHCDKDYPRIFLRDFKLTQIDFVYGAAIYKFERIVKIPKNL